MWRLTIQSARLLMSRFMHIYSFCLYESGLWVVVTINTIILNCRYVVMTTSGGIMDHEEARRKHLGGKILGFFF